MDKDYRRLIKSVEFVKTAFKKEDFLDNLPQIALAGRSNVGKSTLINALLNRTKKKIAKVSSSPGYTRSVNFILINKEFYLVDLPGFGYAKISKQMKRRWEKLMNDYFSLSRNIKAVLHLVDIRRLLTAKDKELVEFLNYFKIPYLTVLTKIDKLSKNELNNAVAKIKNELEIEEFVLTSGVKKIGIDELWEKILNFLGK